jgi:hypothetical protein
MIVSRSRLKTSLLILLHAKEKSGLANDARAAVVPLGMLTSVSEKSKTVKPILPMAFGQWLSF